MNYKNNFFEKIIKNINFLFIALILTSCSEYASAACTLIDAATVGSGSVKSNNEFQITPDSTNQVGAVWVKDRADLSQAFDYSTNLYLGSKDVTGADGMAFVLQTSGLSALGRKGRGLGGGDDESGSGLNPSLIIEIDTYDNLDYGWSDLDVDHIAIYLNGNGRHNDSSLDLAGPKALGNVEDGAYHNFRITWNPLTKYLTTYFDGVFQLGTTVDLISKLGTATPYWGYTASTGSYTNRHAVCNQTSIPTAPVTAPNITLSPPTYDFGSVAVGDVNTYTFTIQNTGNAIGNNFSIYDNSNDYIITSHTCGSSLAAGEQCSATVGFKPTSSGSRTALLTASITGDSDSSSLIGEGNPLSPRFELENQKAIAPGAVVLYPHVFTARADGMVSFSIAAEYADPTDLTWSVILLRDVICDGQLGNDDSPLVGIISVSEGDQLCILAKVLAPNNASSGATYQLTIQSNFVFAGSVGLENVTQQRSDITQVIGINSLDRQEGIGQLELRKLVWNMTRNSHGSVALPGETLRYIIEYENVGNGPINELVIHDNVPEFTELVLDSMLCSGKPAELPLCVANNRSDGSLSWWWIRGSQLLAGSHGEVSYDVMVE